MHHRTNQATGTHENAIQGTGMSPFAYPLFLTHPTSQYLPCPISCTGMWEEVFPPCKRPHLCGQYRQTQHTHMHRYVPFSFLISYLLTPLHKACQCGMNRPRKEAVVQWHVEVCPSHCTIPYSFPHLHYLL